MATIPKNTYPGQSLRHAGYVSMGAQLDANAFGAAGATSMMELAQSILSLSSSVARVNPTIGKHAMTNPDYRTA